MEWSLGYNVKLGKKKRWRKGYIWNTTNYLRNLGQAEIWINTYLLIFNKQKEREEPRWQSTRMCSHSLLWEHRNHTSCWTIIDRKTLELTKKDTPHPKTKEKPQWDGRRGAITVKSNPITAGWVTHRLENTYTTEVHTLEWRFWAPRQASQTGGLATGGGIPRESDFEA